MARTTRTRSTTTSTIKGGEDMSTCTIAEVPDGKFLATYIGRKIGTLTDFEVFDAALALKHNVLIEGPTGTGKTSAIMAYAAHKQMAFYSISSSNGTEPTQLFGKYIPNPDGSAGFIWQDGPVTDLVRHGGILLINEVNFIPERVLSVLFGLLDRRRKIELVDHRSEVIYAPDNFLVFADMNPDYEGTRPLNKAFRNRFATQLHFDYDTKIEAKLISSKSLRDLAKQLRDQIAQGLYDTPVSTNMLIEFEELAKELNVAFAITNFVNHFPSDDRASVANVLATWTVNLETDIAALKPKAKAGAKGKAAVEVEEVEADDADDWGIEGVDWEYEFVEEEEV